MPQLLVSFGTTPLLDELLGGTQAEERFVRGYELGLGAGISVGHATLGLIGYEGRYDYGVLGSVTNLAARLSDQAEAGQILLSQRAYAALEEQVEAKPVGDLQVKGFARPVQAFSLSRVVP